MRDPGVPPATVFRRREILTGLAAALLARPLAGAAAARPFRLRYALASCMYGDLPLSTVMEDAGAVGAEAVDLWPPRHGTQRLEADSLGHAALRAMERTARTKIAITTRYDLGPFALKDEIEFARAMGVTTIVTDGRGATGLTGSALRAEVAAFIEKMKPTLAAAADAGVAIAIENHPKNLFQTPDALRVLADQSRDLPIGVTLAPHHLRQDSAMLAQLVRDLGNKLLVLYAWQYGKGAKVAMPKEDELLQLPGRGPLDFGPMVRALREIDYRGWVEVFMHPVPRGIPILENTAAIRTEISRARRHLDSFLIPP